MNQFWGKYRGIVVDNEDPLMLGRLNVTVPKALGDVAVVWAMPCVPYAGLDVGFAMAPPIGAAVWVEFEGGDLDYPIWSGCYWRQGERPRDASLPTVKLIKTAMCQLKLDDMPGEGGFTLSVADPAVPVPVTVRADTDGLSIVVGDIRLTITGTGASINAEISQQPAKTP